MTSRSNTVSGGTITYTYDRASNLASTTDTRGTASYAFNTCKVSSSLRYRYNSGNDGANQLTKAAVTGGTAPAT